MTYTATPLNQEEGVPVTETTRVQISNMVPMVSVDGVNFNVNQDVGLPTSLDELQKIVDAINDNIAQYQLSLSENQAKIDAVNEIITK
jgi:hypothetical protein